MCCFQGNGGLQLESKSSSSSPPRPCQGRFLIAIFIDIVIISILIHNSSFINFQSSLIISHSPIIKCHSLKPPCSEVVWGKAELQHFTNLTNVWGEAGSGFEKKYWTSKHHNLIVRLSESYCFVMLRVPPLCHLAWAPVACERWSEEARRTSN